MAKHKTLIVLAVLVAGIGIWLAMRLRAKENRTSKENTIQVSCQTTKGELDIVVMPEWAPRGAERFLQLVDDGFFNHLPLFRCIDQFLCQFGSAPPRPNSKSYPIFADDPPRSELRDFKSGYISFAGFGPNSRSTHIFIALTAAKSLGTQPWETPFGYVKEESFNSTAKQFTTSYGETAPTGRGPETQKIEAVDGAEYLKRDFPLLDYFLSCARKN